MWELGGEIVLFLAIFITMKQTCIFLENGFALFFLSGPKKVVTTLRTKTIEDKFGYNLYRDVGDLYGKSNSQREFYTMPATTIPNNQTACAKWLYNTGPTCKEKSIYCTPEMDAVPYIDNTNPYTFTNREI